MRILILGAGAVGGYFGALLHSKGMDVTFLVREKRAAQLQAHGLKVDSPLGNISIIPKLITLLQSSDKFDLVIISCKSYSLDDALKSLASLEPSTYVLPLLNGLSHYPKLEEFFGKHRVLGGFAHLSVTIDNNGHIVHINKLQKLIFGALQQDQIEFVQYTGKLLASVAPFVAISNYIRMDIWKKLIFISTVISATCLLKKTIGTIASTPEGIVYISKSFKYNCLAAAFAGYKPDKQWKNDTLKELLNCNSTMTSSVFRDMQNRNPVELSVLEDMIKKNREAGIHNELLESGYLALQFYELKHAV